jgi:hypothetical protein
MARSAPGAFRYLALYAALLIGAFLAATRPADFFPRP